MSATVIYGESQPASVEGQQLAGDLWLDSSDLTQATGWEIKPEGICRDELCIPVPEDRASALLRQESQQTWLNLSEFARYMEQPYASDEKNQVWYFGEASAEQQARLLALEAPDFTLPDLNGNLHSLSDYRNKKVLLLLWASW